MRPWKTPADQGLAPCYPSKTMDACMLCERHRVGTPPLGWYTVVVIDASVVWKGGDCPMFEARPVARAYVEVDHA